MTYFNDNVFEDNDFEHREDKRLITLKETSELFSIPLNTLFKWSSRGKFPRYKIGRRVYVNPEEFTRWLENYHLDAMW